MRPVRKAKGSVLPEVLLCAALLVTVAVAAGRACQMYGTYLARLQMDLAAQLVVLDLRRLREETIVSGRLISPYMATLDDSTGYMFIEQSKTTRICRLNELVGPEIRMHAPGRDVVCFYGTGSPSVALKFHIRHRKYPDMRVRIILEPVSGRIIARPSW